MDETEDTEREDDKKETGKISGGTGSGGISLSSNENTEKEDDKKGTGKTSGGAGGGIRLPPNKLKEVMQGWEHLDAGKVVARLAEFFSELPARASANVEVSWANLKNRGYAIVTNLLAYGQQVSSLMQNLTRENIERLRNEYGVMIPGPSG